MSEPATKEEYDEKFLRNSKIEGYGINGVRIHVPCPFCAEPDVMVHGILETESAYAKGATCGHCSRGFRMLFTKTTSPCGHVAQTRFGFVQTSGPDPAPWIAAAFPRDAEVAS